MTRPVYTTFVARCPLCGIRRYDSDEPVDGMFMPRVRCCVNCGTVYRVVFREYNVSGTFTAAGGLLLILVGGASTIYGVLFVDVLSGLCNLFEVAAGVCPLFAAARMSEQQNYLAKSASLRRSQPTQDEDEMLLEESEPLPVLEFAPIEFKCRRCGHAVEFEGQLAGCSVMCAHCGRNIIVPMREPSE